MATRTSTPTQTSPDTAADHRVLCALRGDSRLPGESQEPSSKSSRLVPPSPSPPSPTQAGQLTWQSSRSRAGHKGNGGGLGQPPLNGKIRKKQCTWAPQGAIQATHCSTPEATLHTDCKTSSLSPGDEAALVLGSGSLSVWSSGVSSSSCLTKTRS